MRRHLLASVAFALVALPALAQQSGSALGAPPADTASVDSLDRSLEVAFANLERREYDRAREILSPLLTAPNVSVAQRARLMRALGTADFEQGRRQAAAQTFHLAREAAEASGDRSELGWAWRWIGALAYGDGHEAEARSAWAIARDHFVAASDLRGEFQVASDLGLLTPGLDQRPLSERCFAIAVALGDSLLEARARRRWGQALLDAAKPGPALAELERAVALMRTRGHDAEAYLGDALAVLGWALRSHGAHDRAVAVHQEALRMATARGDVNAQIWNNHGLGTALAELGRYAEAEVAMRDGLAAARTTGAATSIRILSESSGWVALRRERWAEAVERLKAAMALPGIDVTVMPAVSLSRAYRALGRYDEAMQVAAAAAAAASRAGLVDNELRALIGVAQVHEARQELAEAHAIFAALAVRLEEQRADLAPRDFLKRGFGERYVDGYELGVRVSMRLGRVADALTAAERLRSRAFADRLAARRQREEDEAEVESGVWQLGGRAPPVLTADVADSPRQVPALDSAGLSALAARLDTTLVVYWVQSSDAYAWIVPPGGSVTGVRLEASPAAIRRAVVRASDVTPQVVLQQSAAAEVSARAADRSAYRALHALLWAPIARWLPSGPDARITVIPHGPLFALPFGALLAGDGRYVVEQYALHYASSGAVLADAATRRTTSAQTRHLVVADPRPLPAATSGVRLPSLAGARREARVVASLLGPDVHMAVGADASEGAVRAAMPGAPTLHFATHAIVSDNDPLGSHLLLGTDRGARPDAEGDGRLTASEVAGLTLAADLVVLGACRSARGQVSSDGIAGLTRAFMAAGAPSVIATLWDVSDDTTARVMTRFYQAYRQGVSKDRALRRAQLGVLRDLRNGRVRRQVGGTTITFHEHPHLWAGAVLLGAP